MTPPVVLELGLVDCVAEVDVWLATLPWLAVFACGALDGFCPTAEFVEALAPTLRLLGTPEALVLALGVVGAPLAELAPGAAEAELL